MENNESWESWDDDDSWGDVTPSGHPVSTAPLTPEQEAAKLQEEQDYKNDIQKVNELLQNAHLRPFVEKTSRVALESMVSQPNIARGTTYTLEKDIKEFEADPFTEHICQELYLNNNRELLKQHSQHQLDALKKIYFGDSPTPEQFNQLQEKLNTFLQFTQDLRPVRSDATNSITEFQSPRVFGKIYSYGGSDLVVQGDNYVYASFDRIPHFMSRGYNYLLDENDIKNRAEIVMQDIAILKATVQNKPHKAYIKNTFDYNTGKKILGVYLASVFDTVDEANSYLQDNIHRSSNEKSLQFPPRFQIGNQEASQEKSEEVFSKIKNIYELTGIVSPLALEVRVPERAKAQQLNKAA